MQSDQIREGAIVRSSNGDKLGKIVACRADDFVVEKGFFSKKDYAIRYDDVMDTRDGEVILAFDTATLQAWEASGEPYPARAEHEPSRAESGDVSIPLSEEQLEVNKRNVEAGAVHARKEVVTENRTVNVPVEREVVSVETRPASGEASRGTPTIEKDEVVIPVREEEVEVSKRPVTKEEVHISKGVEQTQQQVSDTVRKEKAKVETEGSVKREDKPRSHP